MIGLNWWIWFRKNPFLIKDGQEERRNRSNRWTYRRITFVGGFAAQIPKKGENWIFAWMQTLKEPTRGASLSHDWLERLKGGLEQQKWGSLMLISEEGSWWRRKEEEGYDTESQDRAVKIMLPRRLQTRGKDDRGRLQAVSERRKFSDLISAVTSCLIWSCCRRREEEALR